MANFSRTDKPQLVLVVSPNEEDHWRLIHILRPAGWSVDSARSCEEAVRSVEIEPARVVIVDRQLPDGSWKTLLSRLTRMPYPPKVIVTSRLADERLWAEVLNLGGFDVLSQPFVSSEVLRCVNSAGRHWDEEWRKSNAGVEEIASYTTA
jgi:DNA-binding response OmpR family regulator